MKKDSIGKVFRVEHHGALRKCCVCEEWMTRNEAALHSKKLCGSLRDADGMAVKTWSVVFLEPIPFPKGAL